MNLPRLFPICFFCTHKSSYFLLAIYFIMCNILHIIKYFIFLYKIYMKMVPSSYFKCLYAVLLILNCFANYSNCITSASSSFSSSIDKDGTKHAISSSNIFPIFFSAHNLISRLIIILENIMNILYRSVSNNNTFIFQL